MGEHGDSSGKQWHHFLAGIAAGASLVIVGYPMDTLKVRQQTGVSKVGVFQAAMQALRQEGILGFYRGVLSPLTGVPPQYAISFGTRMVASQFLPMDPNSTAAAYISGGISGFTTTVRSGSALWDSVVGSLGRARAHTDAHPSRLGSF